MLHFPIATVPPLSSWHLLAYSFLLNIIESSMRWNFLINALFHFFASLVVFLLLAPKSLEIPASMLA